jgi:ketosteroid isomerase-like protein
MRKIAAALVLGLLAAPAAAATKADQADVLATVRQFIEGFNKGDVKSALAACASPVSVVDEFAPYAWQGPTACADWANDFDAMAKKNGITDSVVTLLKPRHVDVDGDRAYVVNPVNYDFKKNGKKEAQKGSTFTVALQKTAAGWRITGWAWSTR